MVMKKLQCNGNDFKSNWPHIWSYDHETWHGAVCTQTLQSLYTVNDDPELTLTHFKTKSNLRNLYLYLQ